LTIADKKAIILKQLFINFLDTKAMLTIKMAKTGKTKMPYFRFVVVEKHKDPWGRVIANVGNYNPRSKEINLDKEQIISLLSKGAQPTKTVHNLFVTHGLISEKKVRVTTLSKKRKANLAKKAEGGAKK